jgi:hypothetical protein
VLDQEVAPQHVAVAVEQRVVEVEQRKPGHLSLRWRRCATLAA